jgi:hypothetical protein
MALNTADLDELDHGLRSAKNGWLLDLPGGKMTVEALTVLQLTCGMLRGSKPHLRFRLRTWNGRIHSAPHKRNFEHIRCDSGTTCITSQTQKLSSEGYANIY